MLNPAWKRSAVCSDTCGGTRISSSDAADVQYKSNTDSFGHPARLCRAVWRLAMMNIEHHKWSEWISAVPSLTGYLETHFWAWATVVFMRRSSREVPAHSDWWCITRTFTSQGAQSMMALTLEVPAGYPLSTQTQTKTHMHQIGMHNTNICTHLKINNL